jgi:chromosome segregation ATPase
MKTTSYKRLLKRLTAIVLCSFLSLLFSQAAFAQDFSSLNSDLQLLEDLILDTIASTEEQQRLLHDLRENLNTSEELINSYESIINEQESLLKDLRLRLNEMSETYRMQSSLSAKYERRSKFWRNFTLVAIPVTAVISGGVVWMVVR